MVKVIDRKSFKNGGKDVEVLLVREVIWRFVKTEKCKKGFSRESTTSWARKPIQKLYDEEK